jgi:putative transposase
MVKHPAEYPWSSYRSNALEKEIGLLAENYCYEVLGNNENSRKAAYRALFKAHISELKLTEIRDATNKAWVLGDNRFKEQIEQQTGRRSSPQIRGGDRKSKRYRDGLNNQ